jgi:hypothetical protein
LGFDGRDCLRDWPLGGVFVHLRRERIASGGRVMWKGGLGIRAVSWLLQYLNGEMKLNHGKSVDTIRWTTCKESLRKNSAWASKGDLQVKTAKNV